jgi:hypothetical protein
MRNADRVVARGSGTWAIGDRPDVFGGDVDSPYVFGFSESYGKQWFSWVGVAVYGGCGVCLV